MQNDDNIQMYLHKRLFHRSLKDSISRKTSVNGSTEKIFNKDSSMTIEYHLNSHGYRSDQFGLGQDIMILGCSNTFGYGLPEEMTWGKIFSDKINKTYIKIAQPGDSAQGQIYKAFKYFEEFENPKIIIACFPIMRIEMPYIPGKLEKKMFSWNHEPQNFKIQQVMTGQEDLLPFSKIPHNPDEILPKEVGIFYTFMFIQILEQYCKSHNIKFIWTIWDDESAVNYAKDNISNVLKNYVYCNFFDFIFDPDKNVEYIRKSKNDDWEIPNCHNEIKDHPLFYRAADYKKDNNIGHWGVHINQHIAESFYNKYMESL